MKKIFFTLCLAFSMLNTSAQKWKDLGSYGYFVDGQSPKMTVLDNGTPIMAYKDAGGIIKVLEWNFNTWQTLAAPTAVPIDHLRITSAGDDFYVGFKNIVTGIYEVHKYVGGGWDMLGDLSSISYPFDNIDLDATSMAPDQLNLIYFSDALSNAEVLRFDGATWDPVVSDFLMAGGTLVETQFDIEDNNSQAFVAAQQNEGSVPEVRFYKDAGGSWDGFTHVGDPFLVQDPHVYATDAADGMNPFVAYVSNVELNMIYLVEADMASMELVDLPTYDMGGNIFYEFDMTVNADNHVIISYQLDDYSTHVVKYDGASWTEITPVIPEFYLGKYTLDVFKASGKPYLSYLDQSGNMGVKTYNTAPAFVTSDAPVAGCEGGSSDLVVANIQFNDIDYDSVYLAFNVISGSMTPAEIEYNKTGTFGSPTAESTFEILLSPLSSGTNVVEIMAIDGLDTTIHTETFLVNPAPFGVVPSPTTDPTSCSGTDGVINLAGLAVSTNFAMNYNYNGSFVSYGSFTSTAAGDFDITGLSGGYYDAFYIWYDATGCGTSLAGTATLAEPTAPPIISGTITNPSLCNANDGSIEFSGLISGEVYLITYEADGIPGSSTVTADATGNVLISGLEDGTYSPINLEMISTGCSREYDGSLELSDPASPNISVITTDATCDTEDGAVDATITGGAAPYSIYWSNGETTEDISGVASTTYYINVIDDNDCYSMAVGTVGVSDISLVSTPVNISCPGGNDGAIILEPTGTAPFTYYWSNGATTQEIADLTAGQYEAFITDASGCMTTASFILTEPAKISGALVTTPATCGSADGAIAASVTGGTSPYTYNWLDATGSSVGTTATITGLSAGAYSLEVVDASSCTKTLYAAVSNVDAPEITVHSVTPSSCASDGEMDISAVSTSTSPVITYEWNTGEATQDLSGKPAGYYSVEATDGLGCMAVKGMAVPGAKPAVQDICIVTVDTTTNTNRVVWEKPVTTEISHYNIYRESSVAGMFQFVDSVLYSEESYFTDPIAYPQLRSWRYKITAVNNCGVESVKSPDHKTIHIVFNETSPGTYEIFWDAYEGFVYPEYNILRYTTATDEWVIAGTQAVGLPTTFIDTPPTTEGLDYVIEVIPPSSCESTGKATDHNSSRSNKTSSIAGPPGGSSDLGITESDKAIIAVYPNPTSDRFNLVIENNQNVQAVNVYDLSGKLIYSSSINQSSYSIDLSHFESSIYLLEVITDKGTFNKKVIKQ